MSDEAKSWKDKLTFLESDSVEHEVNGTMISFHAVSLGTLFEIKVIGEPLAKALAVLFDDKGRDYGTVSRNFYQPNSGQADQRMDNELIVEPRTPEMAALRAKQREESIGGLIEALLNDKSKAVLGKLIVESMKDYFDKGQVPPGVEFMNQIPATSIVDFLTGVAKANKGVLGPLAESLTGLWAKAKNRLNSALASEDESESSSPTEDTPASESPVAAASAPAA